MEKVLKMEKQVVNNLKEHLLIPVNEIIEEFNKKNLNINEQKWECLETGFVSTAGGLSHYQKKRGIDKTKRKRIY